MLLILSNSQDATSDYLAGVLRQQGVEFRRFDTDRSLEHAKFHYQVSEPRLQLDGRWYTPNEFRTVWYRRPERLKPPGSDNSAETKFALDEWAEALEAFFAHIPPTRWMNHPASNVAASHKLEQLTTAARLGFTIPRTLVTHDAGQLQAFFNQLAGGVIVKPMSSGYLERPGSEIDTIIYTNQIKEADLRDLTDLSGCPTLFQEYIAKSSDVRITAVDGELHAVELIAIDAAGGQRCDVRRNNMTDVMHRVIDLPGGVERGIRKLLDHYGLRYAALDFAVTSSGEWVFFEVNPNGQWAWMDLAGVTNIAKSFVRSFTDRDRQ